MRSDSYPHQWGACRRPVISAGEEPGNHFPLLFRALHTAGNRGNVRTLPEYDRVSNPQDVKTPAKENGGAFTWGIRLASLENGHINKDTEDSIKQRLVTALFKFRFDEQPYKKTE